MKIKLFSAKLNKAESYCNFFIVFNKTYFFTFLIESPFLNTTNRNLIRMIWFWITLLQLKKGYVKFLRIYKYNRWVDGLITKVLKEVNDGADDRYIRYSDICNRVEKSVKEYCNTKFIEENKSFY